MDLYENGAQAWLRQEIVYYGGCMYPAFCTALIRESIYLFQSRYIPLRVSDSLLSLQKHLQLKLRP